MKPDATAAVLAALAELQGEVRQLRNELALARVHEKTPRQVRAERRQAVAQLLRSSDPARLRARVLKPLVDEQGALQRRLAEIEASLAAAEERARFVEAEAAEAAKLRERVAYLDRFAMNAGDYLDTLQRLVREREAELRATGDSAAWCDLLEQLDYQAAAIAEGQGAPVKTTEGGGALHDLEAAAAEAAAQLADISDE